MTSAEHPGFSTNHLADIDKTTVERSTRLNSNTNEDTTVKIYCMITPPLSGAMEDCSIIVTVQQLQMSNTLAKGSRLA